MDKGLSVITLYEKVLEDCRILIKNNVEENTYDDMVKEVGQDLKKIISFYRGIFHNSPLGVIRTFAIEYLDEMKMNIEQEQKKSEEIKENEIYSAYLFIFSFLYINKLSQIDEIVKFKYESHTNFSEILKRYGNPDILKENYENNAKQIINGNFEKKNLKKFIEVLKKKKSTQKNTNIGEKTKVRKRKNIKKNIDLNAPLNLNKINIQKEEEKKDENDIINNIDDIHISKESKEPNIKIDCEIMEEKILLNTKAKDGETKEEKNIDNIKFTNSLNGLEIEHEANVLNGKGNINNSTEENLINFQSNNKEEIKLNSNDTVKENEIYANVDEIKKEFTDKNIIKEETLPENKNTNDDSKIDIMGKNEENTINLNNIKNETIIDNTIENEIINDDNKKYNDITIKSKGISKNNNDNKNIKNGESNVIDKSNKKNDEEEFNKNNISYEKLVQMVFELKQDNIDTKKELEKTKEELLAKIKKLEDNQKLMYYLISMYHSRDMSKSIYFYFAKHLNIKNHEKPFFDLKEIMEYLAKNGGKTTYSENEKEKFRKFFKSLFFVNNVNNKVMHNNISSKLQKEINEFKNEDDLLSLIPTMSYNQLFDTLGFYVENNTKNPQIQKAMQYVYEREYINDPGLGKIKDLGNEAIIKQDDGFIKMLITKEEISDVKLMFSKIMDFEKDCEMKTWG